MHDNSISILDGGGGLEEFAELAEAEGLLVEHGVIALNEADAGCIETLCLFAKNNGPYLTCVAMIARAIVKYLTERSERRVVITKDSEEEFVEIDARGYNEKELSKIIDGCHSIVTSQPAKKGKNK